MQAHRVDEIDASKTYRYKIDFVLDDVVPIVKRTYGGNIGGIEQKYRRQENKGKVWGGKVERRREKEQRRKYENKEQS